MGFHRVLAVLAAVLAVATGAVFGAVLITKLTILFRDWAPLVALLVYGGATALLGWTARTLWQRPA